MQNEPLTLELTVPTSMHRPQRVRRPLLQPSPDHPDDYILSIDHSSLESFNVCARKAEYSLVQRRQPIRNTSALSFGTAIHSALETSLLVSPDERLSQSVISKQQSDILSFYADNPVPLDEYRTAQRAIDVIAKYRTQFQHDIFEVLYVNGKPMVEVGFALPLGTVDVNAEVEYDKAIVVGHREDLCLRDVSKRFYIRRIHILWSGRIDAAIVMDGRIWVMDHKTSSMGGENFMKSFMLSAQTIGYTWALQELLNNSTFESTNLPNSSTTTVAGLLLNAIICRRPTKTGTGTEFLRQRFYYDQQQLEEWKHNTLTLVSDFLSHLQRGYFPQQTQWCVGKYGLCSYFDVCTLPSQQRAQLLHSNLFEDITWSPTSVRE